MVWHWIGDNSRQLELLIVFPGTVFIAWQVFQSRKNINALKRSHEQEKGIETLKFIRRIAPDILKGAKWSNRNKRHLNISTEEYRKLKKEKFNEFDKIQDKAKEYLTPLHDVGLAVTCGLLRHDVVKEYESLIKGTYTQFRKYIEFIQETEPTAYNKIKEMLEVLKKYDP